MMNIDLERNPSLLKGVLTREGSGSGLRLFRHPDHRRYMPQCTAGCRLAFTTNASKFRLSLLALPPNHSSYPLEVDLLIDKKPVRTFSLPDSTPETPPEQLICEDRLPGREAAVEIYLPNCRCVHIQSFEISDGAYILPLFYPGKPIIFLGDSITQGFYASPATCWSSRIAGAWNADFFNMGTGGAWMKELPVDAAMTVPWKRAFVSCGVNDSGPNNLTAAEFEESTAELLKRLTRRSDAEIFLLTPIPLLNVSAQRQARLEQFRRIITRTGALFPQVAVIDGHSLVEEKEEFFFDGCHPNGKGMKQFAENLQKQMERLL